MSKPERSVLISKGALWRSRRFHHLANSLPPQDNEVVDCEHSYNRKLLDRRHPNQMPEISTESHISRILYQRESYPKDDSDLSDASNRCSVGYVQKKRRRKTVARSLILEPRMDVYPGPEGLSDSGVLIKNIRDSSSSSDCNIRPVRASKKKSRRRRIVPQVYSYTDYSNTLPPPLPPRRFYNNCYRQRHWTSVLADQVDAQSDKISELERVLDHKKGELMRLEQNLHQEMLARSSVENSKLELLTELSNLRLRLTAAERDRKESDDKCRKLENELITVQTRIFDHENEQTILKGKLAKNGTHMYCNSKEDLELEKLKSALNSVIVSNDEKDQKIEGLRSSLTKYKKLQDMVLSNHCKKVNDVSVRDHMHENDILLNSFCNEDLKRSINNSAMSQTLPIKPSSPVLFSLLKEEAYTLKTSENLSPKTLLPRSNSVENLYPPSLLATSLSPQYGTIPRQTGSVLQQLQSKLRDPDTDSAKTNSAESRTFGGNPKSSGVTFAVEECVTIPSPEKETTDLLSPLTPQPFLIKSDKDKKGILKFFSKWKKSGSQNIDRVEGEFKRGGIRATAGPRLGWSREVSQETDIPFSRWNTDMIVDWLYRLGLSVYANDCKRWNCTADILIKASASDLEKELGIKNHMHRKKLILAIKSMSGGLPGLPETINKLDHYWVVRWLDDIGLPQYKDAFSDARVDGRVLHCLTVDDLLYMKVTCHLHHISISKGIQLLREKGFDSECLIRRSLPDESKSYSAELVAAWSNHRVMEWLRTVDLSEYAPNLRGSGVHGALIIYEVRFNTNLFATLLNIPPTKTLLRRHLATHFKHIVGEELGQLKREKETEAPLSPSIKVKTSRKPQFPLKKKSKKGDSENEEYVCPMDIVVVEVQKPDVEKLIVRRNSDPSPQDQRLIDLKAVLQDENLNESPTTIV